MKKDEAEQIDDYLKNIEQRLWTQEEAIAVISMEQPKLYDTMEMLISAILESKDQESKKLLIGLKSRANKSWKQIEKRKSEIFRYVIQEASKLSLPEWFQDLSNKEIQDVETKYGELANDLLEVADMISQADKRFNESLKKNKFVDKPVVTMHAGRKIQELSSKELGGDAFHIKLSLQAERTIPIVMRILYSLLKFKRKITYLVGKNIAKNFFEQLRDTLQYVDITPTLLTSKNGFQKDPDIVYEFVGNDAWSGKRKIDDYIDTIKEWHELDISKNKPAKKRKKKARLVDLRSQKKSAKNVET
jgi:hypothetical protein